jgi:hypothetical protein|tara:strand:+ start:200 stop:493 length:294 start_codon:yes stop_codon:yes gene_type:complete
MILRFVLTISIFLPTLAAYAHELSHDEHQQCEETTVHFHQKEETCFLDDFIASNTFLITKDEEQSLIATPPIKAITYEKPYNYTSLFFRLSRGPPQA